MVSFYNNGGERVSLDGKELACFCTSRSSRDFILDIRWNGKDKIVLWNYSFVKPRAE
jgi:hypothetical protein